MTVFCPDCYRPLPSTRRRADGRCDKCRPKGKRHRPQTNGGLDQLINEHRGAKR